MFIYSHHNFLLTNLKMKKVFTFIIALAFSFAILSCGTSSDSAAENAEEQMEEAGEAIEETADEVEDAADEAAEEMEEAAEDAADSVDNGM